MVDLNAVEYFAFAYGTIYWIPAYQNCACESRKWTMPVEDSNDKNPVGVDLHIFRQMAAPAVDSLYISTGAKCAKRSMRTTTEI